MKNCLLSLVSLTVSLSTIFSQEISNADSAIAVPKIYLIYLKNGIPFDQACAQAINKPVKQEETDEIFNRLAEFQALWEKDGPLYLQTAMKEVGALFPYREMQATLTLCEFTSMSSPLLIYVKRFLSTADKPLPGWAFAEILFHEIMHTYTRYVNEKSALRKKYSNEAPVILNHLHTMALEKMVLTKLNKTEILSWLDIRYRNQFGPQYKRAWEIVNDVEGYQAFIDELKTMANSD